MKLNDIAFKSRIPIEAHPRYPEIRRLIGLRDFAAYREVFERGWAETSILAGESTRLEDLQVTSAEPTAKAFAHLMGVNEHALRRVRLAQEFFELYERVGRDRFLKEFAIRTGYVQDIIAHMANRTLDRDGIRGFLDQRRQSKRIQHRIITFSNLYENMKRHGALVGQAHTLHDTPPPLRATDLPWAIDYGGYVKLREGAHRRAAASALGWTSIPTLVFEFQSVNEDTLGNAHPYIRDNLDWFTDIMHRVSFGHSIQGG